MLGLHYRGSSDSEDETDEQKNIRTATHTIDPNDVGSHLRPNTNSTVNKQLVLSKGSLISAPDVVESNDAFKYGFTNKGTVDPNLMTVDPNAGAVEFNPTYDQLFKQAEGPLRPRGEKMKRNVANGFLDCSTVNAEIFESQRRQFAQFDKLEKKTAEQINTTTGVSLKPEVLVNRYRNCKKPHVKRKRLKNLDSSDIDNYTSLGWAEFDDVVKEEGPSAEDREILDTYLMKMRKKGYKCKRMNYLGPDGPKDEDERFELHVPEDEVCDYQGRGWWDIEQIKQRCQVPMEQPARCYLPKKMIHKFIPPVAKGKKKGLTQLRMSKATPHLFLTAGFDGVARVFRLYGKRQLMASYFGHLTAIKDMWMTSDAKQFVTSSFDRYSRWWDVETGKCLKKYTSNTPINVVRIHPEEEFIFLTGQSNKKIIQWDTRLPEDKANVLTYERHTKAVNTITWVDGGNKIITTADDKTLRCWEYGIPIDYRLIADPEMHSMPTATLAPSANAVAFQSLDNKILIYDLTGGRVKLLRKRIFRGHCVAGYGCQVDWSPDQEYLLSGDGDGKVFIWDFRRMKLLSRFKAHNSVTIGVKTLPFETSKMLTWSWDGSIKLWD